MTSAARLLVPVLCSLSLAELALAAPTASPLSQARPAQARAAAEATITLPAEDATLTVDGQNVDGSGTLRTYRSEPLAAGAKRSVTFSTEWKPNSYTSMTRSKTVALTPGAKLTVDLSQEAPDDRVRVIYVPTPQDIAEEMVKLAQVTPKDVIFEPGCGDARISIAALRMGGARRGLCIDIDPERVEESRARVSDAGMSSRLEVRLGDALDVKNLSEITVVMLYMGDHFDMLIRPVLWQTLPVGARIVSHRFKMGDWEPDRTVHVTSDSGGEYELHLWTITEEVKRRARGW